VFRKSLLLAVALGVALSCGFSVAHAQAWPAKSIKMIVGYPPGGGADVIARILAERLSRSLGQQVVVENRAGASGTIGTNAVTRADADGYTLLLATISDLSIAPAMNKSLPFDVEKDLQPIIQVARGPYLLVANPNFPPNTLPEMVAYLKANPGKVSYSSFGEKTLPHLFGEMFKAAAGVDSLHVPYKGSGPSIADLVGGQIQYSFDNPAVTLALVKGGKLKAIAVTSTQRLPGADSIPTVVEGGQPELVGGTWYGLLAPAKTPRPIIDRLNADMVAILKSPEMVKILEDRYFQPVGGTPEDLGRYMTREIAQWRQLAAKIGLKIE
jgi:tripartite-type tricarboxylate transporter receptor subunit TctC